MKSVKGRQKKATGMHHLVDNLWLCVGENTESFWDVQHFPNVSTLPLDGKGEPVPSEATDQKCEKCGSAMVVKTGRHGKFFACSAYPNCKIQNPSRRNDKVETTSENVKNAAVSWSFGPAERQIYGLLRLSKMQKYQISANRNKMPKRRLWRRFDTTPLKEGGIFFGCSKYLIAITSQKNYPIQQTQLRKSQINRVAPSPDGDQQSFEGTHQRQSLSITYKYV